MEYDLVQSELHVQPIYYQPFWIIFKHVSNIAFTVPFIADTMNDKEQTSNISVYHINTAQDSIFNVVWINTSLKFIPILFIWTWPYCVPNSNIHWHPLPDCTYNHRYNNYC